MGWFNFVDVGIDTAFVIHPGLFLFNKNECFYVMMVVTVVWFLFCFFSLGGLLRVCVHGSNTSPLPDTFSSWSYLQN